MAPFSCRCSKSALIVVGWISVLAFSSLSVHAKESTSKSSKQQTRFSKRLRSVANGFSFGDNKILPYASLDDWFDPYAGMKLEHGAFWSQTDRMFHHVKFETIDEFSWKFRYLANTISSDRTKFNLLFKIKLNPDDFYYGIGNTTIKSERVPATYSSVFAGIELARFVSDDMVFRWSPGYWKFESVVDEGSEFEATSDAQYATSRFTLSDSKSIRYWQADFDHQWSSYLEVGLPVNSSAATYVRVNGQTFSRLPMFGRTKFGIGTRLEWLISSNRDLVPYFALPEVGSQSGLRGFSRERFRNYAVGVLNLEFCFPVSNDFEIFLLSDFAQSASNPARLPAAAIHVGVGLGFRLTSGDHPISVGLARSTESLKLFATVAVGSPW